MNSETQFPPVPSPDPDFCPPCDCPPTIAQPRFSSPRTELSPEELERLERFIMETNDLLLGLDNPRQEEQSNNRPLQLSFRRLRGTLVHVRLKQGSKRNVFGTIQDAGLNYLQVNCFCKITLIPFHRILTLTRFSCRRGRKPHEGELREIDACFRRALVLDFGKVVADSLELTNLFYGVTLSQKVQALSGSEVIVYTEDEQMWRGTVLGADEDALQLCVKNTVQMLKMNQITAIRLR